MSGFGSDFTVGVEEELLLVDPAPPHGLAHVAEAALRAVDLPPGRAGYEAYAAEIELRTPVCRDAGEAVGALRAGRAAVRAAGYAVAGSGLHPQAAWGDARLVDEPRYRRVEDDMRGLIRRTPECALHVHVGMPDEETAIRVFNRLRHWLPLLQALAANSPFWFGGDSGMAGARWAIVRAYPGRGIPRALRDWADWEETMGAARRAGGFVDYTHVWWDVRLHPRHGTVEVRELDAQAPLDHVAAIVALVHALARRAADEPPVPEPAVDAIGWSAFRAVRDGVDAEVLDGDGRVRPVRAIVTELLGSLSGDGLELLRPLVAAGAGAGCQRRAGDARGATAWLVEATAAAAA